MYERIACKKLFLKYLSKFYFSVFPTSVMCLFQRVIIRYRNLHTYNQSLFALISFTLQNAVYPSLCSVASVMSNLCDPMDGSPPGSSIHEILQARVLESVAISFSSRSSQPRDQTHLSCVSCIGRHFQILPL